MHPQGSKVQHRRAEGQRPSPPHRDLGGGAQARPTGAGRCENRPFRVPGAAHRSASSGDSWVTRRSASYGDLRASHRSASKGPSWWRAGPPPRGRGAARRSTWPILTEALWCVPVLRPDQYQSEHHVRSVSSPLVLISKFQCFHRKIAHWKRSLNRNALCVSGRVE